ncbi:competence/damage-inducible protein cinA [Desulfocicer vacuolatum DSM 3385]|uniref:CinA-like protein n=1 Tax=Desulfocicer vacuolatum DSM 3385 TaxID=1121400 RepID=A0A1W2CQ37_9BACT|nr:CinA family nicotinamide mononucleotide deamidase-related protein [Desulfocicer vacuolatum]SMC87329.1 competence/damage-inducible protein cinA [Desulfocicer vacuolatum DSM 3385]
MKAEILSTGDEVLWGEIDDSNASWLARRLRECGVDVTRVSCVGDDIATISSVMAETSSRCDMVLVTGGLGPTGDDLSAQAAAVATGDDLILNKGAFESMADYFALKGWDMTKGNEKQAMLPSKAVMMDNVCGTAPGFCLEHGQARFYFMPGVPREMKAMFNRHILPELDARYPSRQKATLCRLTLFGLPESKTGHKLRDFYAHFPGMRLGFRASFPFIQVKFGSDPFAGDAGRVTSDDMAAAKAWVLEQLGRYVISTAGISLEARVGELLKQKGQTLAVAESCTGGLIASQLTDVAGSSDYFLLSAVTYANDAKMAVLGVKKETLAFHGAVHEQTALEMALGVRERSGADWGVSTSGVAGPGGGSESRPVGMVCIGVAGPDTAKAFTYNFSYGDRGMNKKMFAAMALERLRRELC